MKRVIALSLSIFLLSATMLVAKEKKNKSQTTQFKVNIHCEGCKSKIEENIPFQKGVKNLLVNMDNHIVTVEYNPTKTDSASIAKAFTKLDLEVK